MSYETSGLVFACGVGVTAIVVIATMFRHPRTKRTEIWKKGVFEKCRFLVLCPTHPPLCEPVYNLGVDKGAFLCYNECVVRNGKHTGVAV